MKVKQLKLDRTTSLIILLVISLLLFIGIPTLARYKNRVITTNVIWDGTIASSFHSGTGTVNDPYIISNGKELAYFSEQLSTNDYDGEYFALSGDILLNEGLFRYNSSNIIEYIKDSTTYYVNKYTNDYYDNDTFTGTPVGNINTFTPLDNFKGFFDAKSYRIKGLYITDNNAVNLGLFTNLAGDINDLYIENALIYGGLKTGGLASNTNGSNLSNIYFNGYVIGEDNVADQTVSQNLTVNNVSIIDTLTTDSINLINDLPYTGGVVASTSITGDYSVSGVETSTIKINNQTLSGGSFDISLGTTLLDNVDVTTITPSGSGSVSFSNVKYNITYTYSVAGGIVAHSQNTTLTNVVNKGYVFADINAGGIIGVSTEATNLTYGYNKAKVESNYSAGGLFGIIEKNDTAINIESAYSTGEMISTREGGIAGVIKNNSATINLDNVFDTQASSYAIDTISNTTVDITNSYFISSTSAINTGSATGSFTGTTLTDLKTKTYIQTNLLYDEYVDFDDLATNPSNVWVFETNQLPALFIDDLNNPIASINAGTYAWNNLSYTLKTINLNTDIAFSIEELDTENPISNAYYYIKNSATPYTKQQVLDISSWTSYSNPVSITEEGSYIIYAKIIDLNSNITYLNSDVIDIKFPRIELDGYEWLTTDTTPSYIYIGESRTATLSSIEDFTSVKYYITNQVLDNTALNNLTTEWTNYTNGITINNAGDNIIYVKLTDANNNVKYINSAYIVLDGYNQDDIYIGKNKSTYSNIYYNITNKSNISLHSSFTKVADEIINPTHELLSSIIFPVGTKITLIDEINNVVYTYKITDGNNDYGFNDSCNAQTNCEKRAAYPFTLFKKVGGNNNNYVETTYYNTGTISESYLVNLDFKDTNFTTNYENVKVYPVIKNANDKTLLPTLLSSIKPFNIYSEANSNPTNANLYLTTSFTGEIDFDTNATNSISIDSGITYKTINTEDIVDTTFEDKQVGLVIKLVDSNGEQLNNNYLKNFLFKIGDTIYSPDEHGLVRIKLGTGINNTIKTLDILTFNNNDVINPGLYYFKIYNYASFDGYYYNNNELNNNPLTIDLRVGDLNIKDDYHFNVLMDDNDRIITKNLSTTNIHFDILEAGNFTNPNIRVRLAKKDQLTAYNQDYTDIDLQTHTSTILNSYQGLIYYVTTNPISYNYTTRLFNSFDLTLLNNAFDQTGYKYIFELYDGSKFISKVEKHFIVR